jgi:hypothetical protein
MSKKIRATPVQIGIALMVSYALQLQSAAEKPYIPGREGGI